MSQIDPTTDTAAAALASPSPEGETIHHQRRKREVRNPARMQLNLTSMIDVIFQLLIYFVITANIVRGEGVILAKLPQGAGAVAEKKELKKRKLNILVSSQGLAGYRLQLEGFSAQPRNFKELADLLITNQYNPEKGRNGAFPVDNAVIIKPDGQARWVWVVSAFNAAIKARYENISFAQARSE